MMWRFFKGGGWPWIPRIVVETTRTHELVGLTRPFRETSPEGLAQLPEGAKTLLGQFQQAFLLDQASTASRVCPD